MACCCRRWRRCPLAPASCGRRCGSSWQPNETPGRFVPACDAWLSGWDESFSRRLAARGWIGMTIPPEYGGHGRSALDRYVVVEEVLAAGAPVAAHWVSDRQVAPNLLRFGTEELKQRYLPAIARGECYFAIGLSEPDAGLGPGRGPDAGTRVDGGWRVSGVKVWTSGAHRAHALIALVRTSPPEGTAAARRPQPAAHRARPARRDDPADHLDDRRAPLQRGDVRPRCSCPTPRWSGRSERAGPRPPPSWPTSAAGRSGCCPPSCCWTRWSASSPGLALALATGADLGDRAARGAAAGSRPGCGRAARCRWRWPGRWRLARPRRSRRRWSRTSGPSWRTRSSRWHRTLAAIEPELGGPGYAGLLAHAVLHAPGFTIRGGTNEILRTVVARGLGLR